MEVGLKHRYNLIPNLVEKADQQVTPIEAEFLQMVATILDCPVTPLYAGEVYGGDV